MYAELARKVILEGVVPTHVAMMLKRTNEAAQIGHQQRMMSELSRLHSLHSVNAAQQMATPITTPILAQQMINSAVKAPQMAQQQMMMGQAAQPGMGMGKPGMGQPRQPGMGRAKPGLGNQDKMGRPKRPGVKPQPKQVIQQSVR
jgi:hypothetical protein